MQNLKLRECRFQVITEEPNDERVFQSHEGKFHGWGYRFRINDDGTSTPYTVGIVEDNSGQVFTILPHKIQFTAAIN